jgi:hypothetical protein
LLCFTFQKLIAALIEGVKEEANTSALNQAYDQLIAKTDKVNIRYLLDIIRSALHNPINQAQLVVICIKALVGKNDANTNKDAWVASFRKVNCHPDYREPFRDWCIKIEGDLNTGDTFFKDRPSLFDAMPAVWKNMKTEDRRVICDIIDSFYNSTAVVGPTIRPWCVDNVKKLVPYVKLDDVVAVRASYFAWKEDPNVLHDPIVVNAEAASLPLLGDDSIFSWHPKKLVNRFKEFSNKESENYDKEETHKRGLEWFSHVCNTVSRQHSSTSSLEYTLSSSILPHASYAIDISTEQRHLLNPTQRDLFLGLVLEKAVGDKATRKIAKRSLDFLNGNVASYAQHVTSDENMKQVAARMDVAEALSILRAEEEKKKQEHRKRKVSEEEEREKNKRKKLEDEGKKKQAAIPVNKYDIGKGIQHVMALKSQRLLEILVYHFKMNKTEMTKLKLNERREKIKELWPSIITRNS